MLSAKRTTNNLNDVQPQDSNAQSNMMRFVLHAKTRNRKEVRAQREWLAKERGAIITGAINAVYALPACGASESEQILVLDRIVNLQGYERRGLPQFQGLAKAVRPALERLESIENKKALGETSKDADGKEISVLKLNPVSDIQFMAEAAIMVGAKVITPVDPRKSDVEEALSKDAFPRYKTLVSQARNAPLP